jgi:hypothetical protein
MKKRRKIQDEEGKEQETTPASAQLFIAVKVWKRSANTRRNRCGTGPLILKVSHEASSAVRWKNPPTAAKKEKQINIKVQMNWRVFAANSTR